MKRKIAVFLLIVGILLVAAGICFTAFTMLKEEENDKKETENTIVLKYDNFRSKTDTFTEIRSAYYDNVAKSLFPEVVEEEYEDWLTSLESYTNIVDGIEAESTELKELCPNQFYSNQDISNKCAAFIIAYETSINYYVKDIIAFNENLAEYRKSDINYDEDIVDYELKYEYVDIDSDGDFHGKD